MGGEHGSKVAGPTASRHVKVGNATIAVVIDTGAVVSTMSETVYRDFFRDQPLKNFSSYNMKLTAANGTEIAVVGCLISDVTVGDKTVKDATIIVMRDSPNASQFLLGTNVLSQLPEFRSFFSQAENTPKDVRKVRSLRGADVIVDAQSISLINATVGLPNDNSTAFLEPSDNLCQGLIVLPSFLDIKSGRVKLPVMNVTDNPLHISPRTVLGEAVDAAPHVDVKIQSATVSAVHANPSNDSPPSSVDLSKFPFPDDMPHEHRSCLERLIRENADIFSWSDMDLGFTNLVEHRIVLTTDEPIAQPSRRIPPQALADVKAHLEQLLAKNIIRPSSSPYASPIVVVRKKNGDIRLCCDFRGINLKTRRDKFPLPKIEESLDALGGAKFFSSLDLASGYHQVAMAEEDIEKTAFVCPYGLFEWMRLPFGLCNAPSTFQRFIQKAMHGYLFDILLAYLDDILVYSTDFQQHLSDLQKVFQRLREVGVKLNPEKCSLGQLEVGFLGHRVSAAGIATDPAKLEAVQAFPVPKTLKNVREFVGLTGYYRRFVKDFARIAKPLHRLVSQVHEQNQDDPCKGEKNC